MRLLKIALVGILVLSCVGCTNQPKDDSSDSTQTVVLGNDSEEGEDGQKSSEYFAYEIDEEKGTSTITSYLDESEKEIVIPKAFSYEGKDYPVTSIAKEAFYFNTAVEKVTIPDSVTSIGQEAFCKCESLKEIEIPGSVKTLGTGLFYDCTSLKKVTLGDGIVNIPNEFFTNCYALEEIVLPETLTAIGTEAFWACESLKEVTLPESVMTLGERVFYSCGVQKLTIQSPAFAFSDETLEGADEVKEIYVPESLTQNIVDAIDDEEIKVKALE